MVAAVFGQTWRFDFVGGFDDNAVLEFANHAGVGVSWRGLLWAFTHTPDTHRWNPLEVITNRGLVAKFFCVRSFRFASSACRTGLLGQFPQ